MSAIKRLHAAAPIILPVYAPTLITAFALGVLIPVLPLYAKSFQDSYSLVGLVVASQGFGSLIGDVPAGVLFGRLGPRRSMVAGIGVLSFFTLAMSWARSIPELIVYGLISGLGMAIWSIARHAYLAAAAPTARRGRAIAIFGGIVRVGTFAGPLVGGAIADAYGFRSAFVLFGALGVLALLFPILFAENVTAAHQVYRGSMGDHLRHLSAMLRQEKGVFSTAGVGLFLAAMIRGGRNVIIPLFAADVIGLNVQQIGLVVGLSSAIDMAMFYPAGMIMDSIGRKFAIVPCFLIQGIGMALVPLAGSYGALLAATLVIGFGNGLGSGTMMTLGADLAPRESVGEFLGVWRLIGDSGRTGAPVIVGGVADLLGLSLAALVIGLVGIAASGVFGFTVPETLQKPSTVIPSD